MTRFDRPRLWRIPYFGRPVLEEHRGEYTRHRMTILSREDDGRFRLRGTGFNFEPGGMTYIDGDQGLWAQFVA